MFSGDLADSTRFANPRRALLLLCRLSCRPTTKAERRNAGTRILYLFEQETQREAAAV
jgi:hypothetical protein